jgi:two-component system, LytTR family, sensor kinase
MVRGRNHPAGCSRTTTGCIARRIQTKVEYDKKHMGTPANTPRSLHWLWIAALWTGIGIFDATQNVIAMRSEGMHHSWVNMFITLMLAWLPWALATPIVIHLGRRFPAWKSPRAWLMHLLAVLGIAVAAAGWTTLLEAQLRPWAPADVPGPFFETWLYKFSGGILPALILYAFILAVSYVLESRQRLAAQETAAARLNEQLSYAQLNALQRQIEPHFIFNALNAIAGLVRERKSEAAVSMIVSLSDFLRRVATNSSDPQVSLAEEVQFLENYLRIQEARFGARLQLELKVPSELNAARIPSLLLQPLVENAIKHGIAKRAEGGAVRISASRSEGRLRLSVYNDGPPLDAGGNAGNGATVGIGLANLRTRLGLLYGEDYELQLQNHAAAGVMVSVAFPYREA